MNPRYQQVIDGEWKRVLRRDNFEACCDCGLIHRVHYRIKGRVFYDARLKIEQRVHRDSKKTRDMRKRMGIKIIKVKK